MSSEHRVQIVRFAFETTALNAGVEARLWKSQFGFRRGHGTEDAIFVALRKIEQACAERNGSIRLLALDWKKSFDSISVDNLLDALRRFGFPDRCLRLIASMMRQRSLTLRIREPTPISNHNDLAFHKDAPSALCCLSSQ